MSTELEPPIFNAGHFLPGVRSGSVTSRVLAALQAKHPLWMEHFELLEACQATRGAVSWAVRYLGTCGDVMAVASVRHPLYLRYRWVAEVKADE
ncbi:MAG: hypothetical protein KBD60_13325 [Sterolibacterium sp.]|jgi:hypothetical protein|nr:hypothetical protein [Sterolibacterium sp.]